MAAPPPRKTPAADGRRCAFPSRGISPARNAGASRKACTGCLDLRPLISCATKGDSDLHRSPALAMEPAGRFRGLTRPGTVTVALRSHPNASPFWIISVLSGWVGLGWVGVGRGEVVGGDRRHQRVDRAVFDIGSTTRDRGGSSFPLFRGLVGALAGLRRFADGAGGFLVGSAEPDAASSTCMA